MIYNNSEGIRLRFLFDEKIAGAWGGNPVEGNSVVCLRAADFITNTIEHSKSDLTYRSYSEDDIRKRALREGDIIIEKSGGGENQPVGRVALFTLQEMALCSNFLQILRPDKKKILPQFGAYLLLSIWLRRLVIPSIKQTTGIQNLDINRYLDNRAKIPPLPTQRRIAAYLDQETTRIDALIKAKERLIELLEEKRQALITHAVTKGLDPDVPMQDSGVDWLGDVPVGWKVVPLRYLTDKIGSGVTPKGGSQVYQKKGVPFLRSQNIHFSGLKLDDVAYISEDIHEGMSNSHVMTGDVLLNITGASIGRCYYYEGELGEVNVNQHVCVVRPNMEILTKYLYFVLASSVGQRQVTLSQTGGGREGLSFESIKGFLIPVPHEVDSQKEIVKELEQGLGRLSALQTLTEQTISLLVERRSALVSNAVTGKIQI